MVGSGGVKVPTQWGYIANINVGMRGVDQIFGSLACIYYVNDPQGYAEGSGFYITEE